MPPDTKRSRTLWIAISFLVSALFIWIAFRGVDFAKFLEALRQVRPVLLFVAIAISFACFPLRVPRWRLLLPDEPATPVTNAALWHGLTIGFTANNVIPLRVGEVVRAATLSRLTGLSFATAFASLAVERVLDGLVIIALLGVGLLGSGFSSTQTLPGGTAIGPLAWRMGIICLGSLTMWLLAAWRPAIALGLLRRIVPRRAWAEKFLHFAERVLAGLGALRDPRRAIPVIGWSLALWLVNALAFWVGFFAFGIHLSFFAALLLQGVVVIAIALPSAPGGLGQFETGITTSLMLYGVDPNLALAYAVGFHLSTLPPILIAGALSLRQVGGSLSAPAVAAEGAG